MRRAIMISWLVMLTVAIGGGVWAAERMTAKSCRAALSPATLASLQPSDELALASGKIVAVDVKDGRLTVSHRGVSRYYLEPGTFVFHIEDRSLLAGLTPGDKIRFDVARAGKRYTITRIENSN